MTYTRGITTKTPPVILNVNDYDDSHKFCTACKEKDTSLNFFDISFGSSTLTICGNCANYLKENL